MNKEEIKNRIDKLKDLVNYHRYLYHVEDREEISQEALDSLKKELKDLEDTNPEFITLDSPTQRIAGQPLDKFEKVKHSTPILSLQDVFDFKELSDWNTRNEKILDKKINNYFCELKLDGLTLVLTYEKGILKTAATRGNGEIGEDVTQNAKTIESIPLKLDLSKFDNQIIRNGIFEIRGEAVLTKKEFERINNERRLNGEELFANPRNVAAGSIRQLDSVVVANRKLQYFAFEIITDVGQKSHKETHDILKLLGFKINENNREENTLEKAWHFLEEWKDKRKTLDYDTDGAVIVVNDMKDEEILGHIGKAERWMVAYKFPAEQKTTIIKDIIVQVGRTGILTPVAVFDPVVVAGSTISRATLHNQDEIDRLDVRIGDTVIVCKAGDVIPDVVKVLTELRPESSTKFIIPEICPVCHSNVVRKPGNIALFCSNNNCYSKIFRRLEYFVSKACFNIEGLGPSIIEQLMDNGLIENEVDIFHLEQGDLEPLEKFAEKKSNNLIESINKSKKIVLSRFINSLGITHIGTESAYLLSKEIVKNQKTKTKNQKIGDLIEFYRNKTVEELQNISNIGEKMAESVFEFFNDEENVKKLNDLESAGIELIPDEIVAGNENVLNKTFVFTGTMPTLERDDAKSMVKKLGGNISESVSKKTNYVVAGESAGSKLNKANELGIKVLNEEEFLELIK